MEGSLVGGGVRGMFQNFVPHSSRAVPAPCLWVPFCKLSASDGASASVLLVIIVRQSFGEPIKL